MENLKPSVRRRGQPAPGAPVISIAGCSVIAGMSEWAYRRTMRPSEGHPEPITNGRPELFRRSEILAWLGVTPTQNDHQ